MASPDDERKKRVTSGGLGVHKRGDGLGTGPVGRGDGYQARKDAAKGGSSVRPGAGAAGNGGSGNGNGSGPRRSGGGGRSPLMLIIIAAIVLLGGGGGLGGLLGGGDSGSTNTGSTGTTGTTTTSGNSGLTGTTGTGSGMMDLLSTLLTSGSGISISGANGSGSTSTGSAGSYSPYSAYGNGGYQSYDYSDYTQGTTGGGLLGSLGQYLGSGLSTSASGVTSGWSIETGNTGVLNTKVASGARAKFFDTSKADNVTIMIYMCGTDLESRSGMATSDLTEIAKADLGDNVNILVYTGGCKKWQNNIVSSSKNQIYRVRKGGLEKLVDNDGTRSMTDPTTLSRFIKWCAQEYPADRQELILWDHGGGSISGYGYDEKNARAGSMDLAQIHTALKQGGQKFDFIGFDACLMATAENAISLSDYADYLLASEETEPGTGWYYTDWVTELSKNPAMSTPQLGKLIIDDFVDVSAKTCRGQSTTLSLVDLAELSATFPKAFTAFAKATSSQIKGSDFKTVSNARSGGREFAQSTKIDQVDLTDMAIRMGTDEAKELCNAVLSAVKYNRTSTDMTNAYGLSIYFPKAKLSQVDEMVDTYEKLGLDQDYVRCIEQFATVQASGQSVSGTTSSPWSMLSGGGSQSTWGAGSYGSGNYGSGSYSAGNTGSSGSMTSSLMMEILEQMLSSRSIDVAGTSTEAKFLESSGLTSKDLAGILIENQLDGSLLTFEETSGSHTMTLPQEQWGLVSRVEENVFYDDGEGYIDLGMDNQVNLSEDGVLTGDTDGTWLSINNQPVAWYYLDTTVTEDGYQTTGRIPVLLNGQRTNLIVVFDKENPYGYVAGARTDYVNGETATIAKSLTQINEGDTLDFLCDYYSYDGEYQDSYYLGEQMTVEGDMFLSYTQIADGNCLVSYCLTDLYGQEYWTNAIKE